MLSPNFKIILLGLISLASVVRGDPSSTTTTSVTTTTTTTSLYTSTSTIQGDDFTTSETLTLTQEAATPHVPGTTTLKALTATVTAPAPTATTTSHACTNFHLSFGKSCCPKKSHCHKKPKPKPKKSKGKKKSRALSSDELYSLAKRQQYAVDSNDGKLYYRCGAAEYQDNNLSTDLGYETTVYTDHVFDTPKYVLFSDIFDPNVCGDLKVDGVKVGSTNCPELTEPNGKFAGGTGQNANNAQDAIKSGIYGYGFFFIPAGTHTVTFLETYMGGAASFALFPACEIQVDTEVISTEVQTSSSATPTVTYTLDPTLTITESFSETTFTTPNAVTDLVFTETPAQVTSTFTPAPVPTTVFQCNSLSIDIQCPRLTSAKQLNNWMVSKLNYYNARTGAEADVAVRCGSVDYTEYYYY